MSSFEAVDEPSWPIRQADMPDPGFRGLRADSPGVTVLDGGIGAGNAHFVAAATAAGLNSGGQFRGPIVGGGQSQGVRKRRDTVGGRVKRAGRCSSQGSSSLAKLAVCQGRNYK